MGDYQHDNPTVSLQKQTILVIEDDQAVGEVFVEILQLDCSHEVVLVSDCFQALDLMKSIKPSLILTDYLLPGMNGIEFYDHLKSIKALANIPVLLISASVPKEETFRRNLPYLRKPISVDKLLNTIRTMLT